MPLVSASVLTTIGLSLITGAVKYWKEGTLSATALEGFDGLLGGVLGNICHEEYNEIRKRLSSVNVPERNADIERCSRHALLSSLITFSEAAKKHLPKTDLSVKDQEVCQHFLTEAQKHMMRQLKALVTLNETDIVLQQNPLTADDALTQVLANQDAQQRTEAMRASLTSFALREFGYPPENKLYQQLLTWLPQGLPSGKHWFVYYIHELHSLLKKDDPPYCRNARRILTQKQLANISLLTKASLGKLNRLITLTEEIRNILVSVEDQLSRIEIGVERVENKVDVVQNRIEVLIEKSGPNDLVRYKECKTRLHVLSMEFVDCQQEVAELQVDLLVDEGNRAERTRRQLARAEKRRADVDAERQIIRQEMADIEHALWSFVEQLERSDTHNSDLLTQVSAYMEAGDFAGANNTLNEEEIKKLVDQATRKHQEADKTRQETAQVLLTKMKAVAAERKVDWLTEATRYGKQAITIWHDQNTLFETAFFLQTYYQFTDAIVLYKQALLQTLNDEEKANINNNLALLLAKYPVEHGQAKDYYEQALSIHRRSAEQNPLVYEPEVATVLNNLANLLSIYPKEHGQARDYYEQALSIYQRFAEQNPLVHEPKVATVLNSLANLLSNYAEVHGQARDYYEQALSIYQRFAEQNPSVYEPEVARILNSLANLLSNYAEEHEQARDYYEQALSIYQRFAKQSPPVYEPEVAMVRNNLANLLAKYPVEYRQAKDYYEQALSIRRRFAEQNPSVYEADVAQTLNNLAIFLTKFPKEREQAKDYFEQALLIRRRLAKHNTKAYTLDLGSTLISLSLFYDINSDKERALGLSLEAYQLVHSLVAVNPKAANIEQVYLDIVKEYGEQL